MGCIGTFEWAINEVESVQRDFERLVDSAENHQLTVLQEAGRENLSELVSRLNEPIEVLSRSKRSAFKEQLEKAIALSDKISAARYM